MGSLSSLRYSMNRAFFHVALYGTILVTSFWSASATAFCGFYVGVAESSLYNDATMVVVMRNGTKTVLSTQNTYQGPPEAFAMIVPVPEVLTEENVKTLPRGIFTRVDRLAAPRLVPMMRRHRCHNWNNCEDLTVGDERR